MESQLMEEQNLSSELGTGHSKNKNGSILPSSDNIANFKNIKENDNQNVNQFDCHFLFISNDFYGIKIRLKNVDL